MATALQPKKVKGSNNIEIPADKSEKAITTALGKYGKEVENITNQINAEINKTREPALVAGTTGAALIAFGIMIAAGVLSGGIACGVVIALIGLVTLAGAIVNY